MFMEKIQIEQFSKTFADQVVNFIVEQYNKTFTCNYRWDWSKNRVCHRGGKYKNGFGINMAMNSFINKKYPVKINEYASFNSDPIIGGIIAKNMFEHIKMFICHEVAHTWVSHQYTTKKQPHGIEWKEKYKILRENFVNPFINKQLQKDKSITQKRNLIKERQDYLKYSLKHNLKESYLDTIFFINNTKYRVAGWNTRARKNFVLISRVSDDKIFVCPPNELLYSLNHEKNKGII